MQHSTCRRASCVVVVVLRAAAGSSGSALVSHNSRFIRSDLGLMNLERNRPIKYIDYFLILQIS